VEADSLHYRAPNRACKSGSPELDFFCLHTGRVEEVHFSSFNSFHPCTPGIHEDTSCGAILGKDFCLEWNEELQHWNLQQLKTWVSFHNKAKLDLCMSGLYMVLSKRKKRQHRHTILSKRRPAVLTWISQAAGHEFFPDWYEIFPNNDRGVLACTSSGNTHMNHKNSFQIWASHTFFPYLADWSSTFSWRPGHWLVDLQLAMRICPRETRYFHNWAAKYMGFFPS